MNGQRSLHKEDTVHVVGHHLNSLYLYLRVIVMNAHPFSLYGFPKFRQFDARLVAAPSLSKRIAHKPTEERSAPFHFQRNHIHTPLRVVVVVITPFHRDTFLASILLLTCYLLFIHTLHKPIAKTAVTVTVFSLELMWIPKMND